MTTFFGTPECGISSRSVHGTFSPLAQMEVSGNQGVEKGVDPLMITLNDPPAKFLLPHDFGVY